jgi:hypothetical protein
MKIKMKKASKSDLDMAVGLARYLKDIERGYMPDDLTESEDLEELIDTSNPEQYERLINGLQLLMRKGSISRVVWGMIFVCLSWKTKGQWN